MAWFLYILLKCIQLLAWPAFTLAYPLCASIQAVETNSIHHMRRLLTYWILFSMISLFDQTFNNLLQWVPVWPCAKILVIFWLIIPDFYGSTIAYNSIVRPRFYMQLLQEAMDMLYKKQDISLQKVSFLAVAERFVHEHGDEALEKPISIKPEIEELTCAQKDQIKAVEIQNESAGDTKNKNVQKEWTCAVCQVTTNSETTLNSHLGGLRHKTRCEELKAGKQTMSKKDVAIGKPNIGMKCTICEVTTQSVATMISHLQGMKHKSKRDEIEAKERAEESNNQNFNNGQNMFGGANKDMKKDYSSGDGPSTMFACNICQVKLNNEVSFKSHLLGKKHKSKCQQFKAFETARRENNNQGSREGDTSGKPKRSLTKDEFSNRFCLCSICNITFNSESDMATHLRGRGHLSQIQGAVKSVV